jgi:predicted nucleic acid-binding protein
VTDVYADSGYWIALLNPNDQWNQSAVLATQQIQGRRIITSEMVLVEFLNGVARFGPQVRRHAVNATQRLYNNPNIEIVKQSSLQLAAAVERYLSRPDQRWSVTDCASFLTMEERGMTEALAHDRDFAQAGFRALLREV